MQQRHQHFKIKFLTFCVTSLIGISSYARITPDNPLQKKWKCIATNNGSWSCNETSDQRSQLFHNSDINNSNRNSILASSLGWITTNDPTSITKGYYYQPGKYANTKTPIGKTSVNFKSAKLQPQGTLMVSGGVDVSKGEQHLSADNATITANPKSKKIQTLSATGDVNLSQPGQLIISNNAHTDLTNNKTTLKNTYYLLNVGRLPGELYTPSQFTGYARGHAENIKQTSKKEFTLKDATLTTGSPYDNDWMISATTINLDKETERGSAYNAIFHIKDIPVMYFPYINFPISKDRKSGLLYPSGGYSSNNGSTYTQPVYLNLAPNYDLTFTPTFYSKRGMLFGSQFRYLTPDHKGALSGTYIAKDKETDTKRWSLSYQDLGTYNENLSSTIIFNRVSDTEYMNDFNNGNVFDANTTTIVQSGSVAYNDQNWSLSVLAQTYQVLEQDLLLANIPYSILPQINIAASYPTTIKYLDYGFKSQLTNFYKSPLSPDNYQVTGIRTYISPFISAPLTKQWGGITPKVEFSQTNYNLGHTAQTPSQSEFPNNQINRSLPILTVASNLNFFKNYKYKDTSYQQTLTPRIFYTYIPYRDQSNIPLFDTSYSNFSYQSLFTPNRFSGYDRINNANQLSYALETSINQKDNGNILFRGGIGQMIYFQPQRVTLSTTNNTTYYQNKLSDIAGFMSYQFINDWYMSSSITYNQYLRQLDSQKYAIQYMPDEDHIFNISYNKQLGDYSLLTAQQIQNGITAPNSSQITTSALWKLTNHWATVGLVNYDFSSNRTTNMYAGVQYNAASWIFKLLYQRYVNIDNNSNNPSVISGPLNTAILFQISLKGLGSPLSQGDSNQLLHLIPGYNANSVFSSQ